MKILKSINKPQDRTDSQYLRIYALLSDTNEETGITSYYYGFCVGLKTDNQSFTYFKVGDHSMTLIIIPFDENSQLSDKYHYFQANDTTEITETQIIDHLQKFNPKNLIMQNGGGMIDALNGFGIEFTPRDYLMETYLKSL